MTLTVLRDVPKRNEYDRPRVEVVCTCGRVFTAARYQVRNGNTKSCGCARYVNKERHGEGDTVLRTLEYRKWLGMKERCDKTNQKYRSRYFLRGITLCKKWDKSYLAFLKDVGRCPGPEYSIDRIDNDKGYFPGNVRWATKFQQRQNQARVKLISYKGKTMCAAEWDRHLGLPKQTVQNRLGRGVPVYAALLPVFGSPQRPLVEIACRERGGPVRVKVAVQ